LLEDKIIRKLVFFEEIINRRVMLLEEIIIRLLSLIEEKIIWKVVFEEIIRRLFCFRRQESIRFLRNPWLLGLAC
jgi:hypothetical protein